MHFMAGLLMFATGIYIWRRRVRPDKIKPIDEARKTMFEFDKLRKRQHAELIQNLIEDKELYYRVSLDAVNRENRAKAALVKVLNASGCSEAQIEEVLAGIDEGG